MLPKFDLTYELNKIPDLYEFYFNYSYIKDLAHNQKRKLFALSNNLLGVKKRKL